MNDKQRIRIKRAIAKSRVGMAIYMTLYTIREKYEKIKRYFAKDAYIYVNYIHGQDEEGNRYKEPYTFNIYICQKGRCESLFFEIDWNEHEKILEKLKKSNDVLKLYSDVGSGTSSLLIPKWAKSKIIEEIEAEKTK